MNPPDDPPPRRRVHLFLAALLLGVGIAAVGYYLWQQFNPFLNYDQTVQESNELRDAARRGSLTDAQFSRVLELAGPSRKPIVSLSVIATLELEAKRSPGRAEPARQALQELTTHPDANVRTAARTTLSRFSQSSPAR